MEYQAKRCRIYNQNKLPQGYHKIDRTKEKMELSSNHNRSKTDSLVINLQLEKSDQFSEVLIEFLDLIASKVVAKYEE